MQVGFVTAVDAAIYTMPRKKGSGPPKLPRYMRDPEKKPRGLSGQELWDAVDSMAARLKGGRRG